MNSYEVIVNSLKWLFVCRAFTGTFSGFFLIFKPTYFKSLNTKLNKWYSWRKRLKPFEIMRETDFYIYRNSQNWGWAMLAGSFFPLSIIFHGNCQNVSWILYFLTFSLRSLLKYYWEVS